MLGFMDQCAVSRRSWREFISILLVCSLGVSVLGWADEDEPIRVAAKSASKSASHERTSFSRPTRAPWTSLGESQGYSMFRISEMAEHKSLQSEFSSIEKDILRKAAAAEIGLSLGNIELIQTNAVMTIHQIPNEKRDGPQTQSLNLGANAFDVKCSTTVNWPRAIEEIYIPAFGPEESEATEWIVKKMKENGISNSFRLESKNESANPTSIANEPVKQLWRFVDGGTIAIAVAIPDHNNDSEFLNEKDPYQMFPWLLAAQAAAVGIDLNSESGRPKIRFALSPKEGKKATEVVKSFEATRSLLIASASKHQQKKDDDEKMALLSLLEDLKRWEISVHQPDSDNIKPFVVIEGELTRFPMSLL